MAPEATALSPELRGPVLVMNICEYLLTVFGR